MQKFENNSFPLCSKQFNNYLFSSVCINTIEKNQATTAARLIKSLPERRCSNIIPACYTKKQVVFT
jgi:hypothetical protein